MSEIKVNSIKGVGASVAALSINNTDGTCTANLTNRTNKNLVVNGACLVAQRGTSSASEGYHTVDRFYSSGGGEDEIPTQAQVDVAAGTTPYTLGFRKAFRLTNGNQTGGAGTSDYLQPEYRIEAQDIANSGWNYVSSSSFITVSFWVKSSVAGDYTFNIETHDGTAYRYLMEYTLSADTWTKVTKTIPGKSDLTFNNDNGIGATLMFYPYLGSAYVQADQENNWYASSNSKYGTTSTTTWWTTDNATWEITGLQLEVGSTVTDFEHRSYAQELALAQRYYYLHASGDGKAIGAGSIYTDNYVFNAIHFPVTMRTNPSIDQVTGGNYYAHYSDGTGDAFNQFDQINNYNTNGCIFSSNNAGGVANMSAGKACHTVTSNSASYLAFSAEL